MCRYRTFIPLQQLESGDLARLIQWPHRNGQGFSLKPKGLPADGKDLVMRSVETRITTAEIRRGGRLRLAAQNAQNLATNRLCGRFELRYRQIRQRLPLTNDFSGARLGARIKKYLVKIIRH